MTSNKRNYKNYLQQINHTNAPQEPEEGGGEGEEPGGGDCGEQDQVGEPDEALQGPGGAGHGCVGGSPEGAGRERLHYALAGGGAGGLLAGG